MNSLQIRNAEVGDASALASLHLACSAGMPDRLENQLGLGYLTMYYRIFLSEPQSVILCTGIKEQQLSGMISGVTLYSDHLHYMNIKRWQLMVPVIPILLLRPSIIRKLLNLRQQPWIAGLDDTSASAARVTFWCWRPHARPGGGGIVLLQAWLAEARFRGASQVYLDVDERNSKAIAIHRYLGARIQVQEFPDGTRQNLVLYDLS
jgi:hypothetical protein